VAVAVALRPAAFPDAEDDTDYSAWGGFQIGEEVYATTPRGLVKEWAWRMVEIWSLKRGSGFGGGFLPEAGGTYAQPAIMIDAFNVMDALAASLPPAPRERDG
jgi:hypothetical protein